LPFAAVALLAGWLAARQRALNSWLAYGVALLAAFLPSLAPALSLDASPARRLIVGLAALAVVLVGAYFRLQAPVVVGGVTIFALALHEIVLVSRLLPTWAPLTAAGIVVLACAITYERRRRDLTRLRDVISRMA
jgi:FtsH-binding integral membrane protein